MFDESAVMLEAATREGGGSYGAFYYLARSLYASKRFDEAYETCAKAREHQPTRSGVLELSSNAARRLGKLEEALRFAEALLALEPDLETAKARCEALRAELKPGMSRALKGMLAKGPRRQKAAT